MNDVGGSESGNGLRAVKSSRTSDANFEYDDSEWDVGIGNLIIDLDADIEKTNEASRSTPGVTSTTAGSTSSTSTSTTSTSSSSSSATTTSTKTTPTTSSSQMHIPQSHSISGNTITTSTTTTAATTGTGSSGGSGGGSGGGNKGKTIVSTSVAPSSSSGSKSGSGSTGTTTDSAGNSHISISMDHSGTGGGVGEKGLKIKIKRSKLGTKSVDAKHEIVKSEVISTTSSSGSTPTTGGTTATTTTAGAKNSDGPQPKGSHTKGDERDGGGNDNNGGKAKPPKRGSTHKKPKSGASPTPIGVSPNKKERNSGPEPSNANTGNTKGVISGPTSGGGVNVKTLYNVNVNIPSVTVGGDGQGSGSAFVKASTNVGAKGQSQTASDGGLIGGSSYDLIRSYGNNTLTVNSSGTGQFGLNLPSSGFSPAVTSASGPLVGSPAKGDKAQVSPSLSGGTNTSTSEKVTGTTNSPSSYAKKPRVFVQPEKNKWVQEDSGTTGSMSQNLAGATTSPPDAASSAYRSLNTGNLNSNNNVSGGSSSDSSATHAGSAVSGGNNFSGFSKDAAKGLRTGPPPVCQDACVGTCVGTVTEPDCLGPCEPGTSVTLEGIVWHETESGVLVVNVTWRGKTYVGTLLDCTKNDWASPRFCDSPTSDLDIRNQKNRGKRGRAQAGTPVSDSGAQDTAKPSASKLRNGAKGRRGSASTSAAFVTPISPLKDPWLKRKTRGSENESQEESSSSGSNSVIATMAAAAAAAANHSVAKATKRLKLSSKEGVNFGRRTNSPGLSAAAAASTPGTTGENSNSNSPALIECPEPNCQKKYKHINGLRYHQSHAHSSHFTPEQDSDSNMSSASTTIGGVGSSEAAPGTPASTATITTTATTPNVTPVIDPIEDDAMSSTCDDSQVTMTGGEDSMSATSTPNTTPVKKPPGGKSSAEDLNGNTNVECDLTIPSTGNKDFQEVTPAVPLTIPLSSLNKGKEDKMEVKDGQTTGLTTTPPPAPPPQPLLSTRPAILTVPNVPFMSLQNRDGGRTQMGGMLTVPRVLPQGQGQQDHSQGPMGPLVLTKPSQRDTADVMSKTGGQGQPKSVPWQPHAHSMSSSGPPQHGLGIGLQHTAHVISSLHPQTSTVTPLTVPQPQSQLHNKDQGGNKDGKQQIPNPALVGTGSGKKPKHKKKSKEKGDRERDGKSGRERERERDGVKGQGGSSNVFQAGSGSGSSLSGRGKFRDERKSSFEGMIGEDGHGGLGSGGDNREGDPQSPAYSDISDANDSGPESDMSLKDCGGGGVPKTTVPVPELKKDAVTAGGHGMSPFYPAFFSPYSLDSSPTSGPNSGSNVPGKDRHPQPPQSDDSGAPSTLAPEKGKSSNSGSGKPPTVPNSSSSGGSGGPPHPLGPLHAHTHPSHAHGLLHGQHPEERRTSPKIDYHPKYLPQQHYYPYPYSNYHFDQPPYGLGLSENPYAHSRVFMDDKEREREIQSQSGHGDSQSHQLQQQQQQQQQQRSNRGDSSSSKRRSSGDAREDSGPPVTIKHEPDFEQRTNRGHKEQRHSEGSRSQSHGQQDGGMELNESTSSAKRSSGSSGMSSHRQSSSASKRDRDREERHARMKDAEGKESSSKRDGSSSSGRHSHSGHKSSSGGPADLSSGPTDSEKEKDQGSKPTMETQGPPPPPTAGQYAYIPQGYLPGNPFALSFDPTHPLYRQVLVPGPYPGNPYGMHGGGIPRFPPNQGNTPLPEDLSRPSVSGAGGGPNSKALDLLQHHAAQYYASQHKIHELHERAMKSPSPQVGGVIGGTNPGSVGSSPAGGQTPGGGPGLTSKPSSPIGLGIGIGTPLGRTSGPPGPGSVGSGQKPADLSSKDVKPPLGSLSSAILGNESCRSPPTQHHVHSHTHHHTHVGIGYPIIPTVPPQYSPHYGVLSSPSPAAAPPVIPPFSSQKPT